MSFDSPEYFYRRLHEGNPGDAEFYERVCEGADKVLELGCGWGRILARLSATIPEVWGLDLNPEFVREARASIRGARDERIVEGDITCLAKLQLPEAHFSRVILPYNTVYALGGLSAFEQCLKGVARLLAPNGEIWFDVYPMDEYQASIGEEELPEDDDEPVAIWESDDGPIRVMECSTIDHESQHLRVDYRALNSRGDELATSGIDHDYLLLPQIQTALDEAGFELDLVLGGFDGRPYDEAAEQLILGASRRSTGENGGAG